MEDKPHIETIQAPHEFSDGEIKIIARSMADVMREHTQAENELASVKQDYKARMERLQLDIDRKARLVRDGFEMRETKALVKFNHPVAWRKCYFRVLEGPLDVDDALSYGELIREEAMSGPDHQRMLPLEPAPEVTPSGEETGEEQELGAGTYPGRQAAGEPLNPLALALQQAAAGKELPLVPVVLSSEFTADKARAQFRKAAKRNGWPEACIDLLDEECKKATDPEDEAGSITRVLQILNAHTVQEAV